MLQTGFAECLGLTMWDFTHVRSLGRFKRHRRYLLAVAPAASAAFAYCLLGVTALSLWIAPRAQAENPQPILITQALDESKLVTLGGNTRPEAKATYDRGRAAGSLVMEHLLLLLKRPPDQERELEKFIDDLHDPSSPTFHRWLTAREFGARFGVAKRDRDAIKAWLRSHGLKTNVDYPNGLLIDFSGTAGQVQEAFHTEIHNLNVKGAKHIANMSDPRIPAALAPAVAGVVSLHDFRPHSMFVPRPDYTVSESGTEYYLVTPGDLETIYNLNPLFSEGISGQGQTIVVIEDSDVYSPADWASFRSVFGLSSYTDGSFTQINPAPPSGTNNCSDPGAENGSDREAIIDAEYASAAAPSAAIVLASCANTSTFGGLIALQNLLNENSPPPALVSMSYGECEAGNGASSNAAFNATFQQAVAEGVSVFVSAGDHAAAGCDVSDPVAVYGIAITGWGSSPYNVSVGGTDFGDTFAGTNNTYWSATNSKTYESALSYVPEIPWNNSCASLLLADFYGFSQTYGSGGFCNSSKGETNFLNTVGGGGGPSACATGTPAVSGFVGGTCAGWPKPSYQSLLGNPSDGVRDIPDVSLFAASGVWLHYYPYCFSGTGGVPCTEAPVNWPGGGGTSFSSPIMAGIQALVNQKVGAPQGNPNFVYYSLAAAEYGTTGDKACSSTLGNAIGSSCIFYDVTQGDNDVGCAGKQNCYFPSGDYGVLSTSDSAYQPAFSTTTGWDFASGIGTVNAYNLVNAWPSNFTLAANPSALSIVQGGQGTTAITITPSNGFSGSVTFTASGLPSGVTAVFTPNPSTSGTTLTLTASSTAAAGTVTATVIGTSSSVIETIPLSLTVTPSYTLSAAPNTLSVVQGNTVTSTITITTFDGFSGSVMLAASGLPNGVTASFNPNPATSTSTLTLTASTAAATGAATITVTGTSGVLSATTTINLTVTPAPSYTLSANPSSVSVVQGSQGTSAITITPANGFSGSVTLSASGLPSGVTAAFTPNPATSTSTLTLTASATATTGTATVTVTGVSGSLTQTTTINLTVTSAPSYTLSANPSTMSVVQSGQGTSTITITPANGFSGSVSLSASGLPSGVTAAFTPNPATSTSTLTLTASATATTGTATVTVTGTSGSLSATTTINLTVTSAPSYTLSANPSSVSVAQGSQGTSTITITPANGFSGSVTLSASGLPSGVTAAFTPNPATSTSTLTLTASATATTGTSTVTVTGMSGSLTQTTTINLTVTPAPSYTLSANPSSVSVAQGSQGTSTITITPANGFSGSVTLSASGLPSGVTAAFTPNPATSTSTLTLTASATATTGTATVTVTGTSGTLSAATTITLTVNSLGSFTLSASPNTLTVFPGSSGTSTITATSQNSFNSAITLSASGLPSGVTATFKTNPVTPPANGTATSVLTLTASAKAATGTTTVTVTGISGALNYSVTIALTVTSEAQTAVYNATLGAPECATVGTSCDSGPSLLLGRDQMSGGTEPNQPNTINNSCADGSEGAFHSAESNDRIVVTSSSGLLTQGKKAKVTATVWAWSTTGDALDLYYAADANNVSWVFIKTIQPTKVGAQKLSATFKLPTGNLEAVRAQFRYLGAASWCTAGPFNDHDDLIFAVQ